MYKFSNEEHTAVTNLETGASGIHPGVWMWQAYQEWVDAGGVTKPFKTNDEYLATAKTGKQNDIRKWYHEHEIMPVTVEPFGTFNGGESSAGAINGAINLAAHYGQSVVKITDINNRAAEYSLQDGLTITAAIGLKASEAFYRKQELMCMVDDAETVEEIALITWE